MYTDWCKGIEQLFEKGLVKKVLVDQATNKPCVVGLFVQCVLSLLSKRKKYGVLTLWTPFNKFYLEKHERSMTHKMNVAWKESDEKDIRENKQRGTYKQGWHFFISKKKKCVELDQLSKSFGILDTINSKALPCYQRFLRRHTMWLWVNSYTDDTRFVFVLASNDYIHFLLCLNLTYGHLFVIFRKRN